MSAPRQKKPGKQPSAPRRKAPRKNLIAHQRKAAGKKPVRPEGTPRRSRIMDVATLAALASAFLPWAASGNASISGISTGDGKIVAVFAGAGFLLASVTIVGKWVTTIYAIETTLAITTGLTCGYHAFQFHAGIGEWIGLLASVVWVVSAVIGIRDSQGKAKKG